MAKALKNAGKAWTPPMVKELKQLAKANTPTRLIGLKMSRSEAAIRAKASDEGISLKPVNQSPYNMQGKKA